jgi:mannose-6-phosphate isomerase-like protein (cupin superfamily)
MTAASIAATLAACLLLGSAPLAAQTPAAPAAPTPQTPTTPAPAPPGQPAPAAPRPRPRAAAPAPAATAVLVATVTDTAGAPLEGVTVSLVGPVERQGTTIPNGTVRLLGVRQGTYRARFSAEGYYTFEKEYVWARGAIPPLEASLNAAPPPPPPPPTPEPTPVATAGNAAPPGDPKTMSVPDYIERNFISGKEPQKESLIGCSAGAQTWIWQVREPWANREHPDAELMLYVVGGEGTLRLGGRDVAVVAGSFAVVPRGTTYGLSRRGRNPIIALATLSGPPCAQ